MMFRSLSMAFLILCSFSAFADTVKCNAESNQMELNACAQQDFEAADKALNQTYKALVKAYAEDKLFLKNLKTAQRAWIAFRDAELEARFTCADGDLRSCWGTMYAQTFMSRKAELTQARTAQLKEMLEDGIGH